jgi:long-subunit acyl-CoA synthetase (AMP-forming)
MNGNPLNYIKVIIKHVEASLKKKITSAFLVRKFINQALVFFSIQILVSVSRSIALNKLQREINEYRKGGKHDTLFPDRWLPAAVAVIGEPFTEQNGLVNSTMKIMRGKVEERYATRIEGLYASGAKNIINPENIDAISN